MLVVEQNTTFINWHVGTAVNPFQFAGDVVIAFDPSKTNAAMVIMQPDGTILNTLEFSGNNRGRGPVQDTTEYCREWRAFMREYLKNVNLYCVGVEQTILAKGARSSYHSNQVLNEIRSNLLNFFLEEFGVHVIEVNNWAWKSAILPDGYRSNKEKGSKRFFEEHFANTPYAYYYEADMTDCICLGWYLCKNKCQAYSVYCNRVEKSFSGFTYSYVPTDSEVCSKLQKVSFNPRFTIEDNLAYYSNRILGTFCMEVECERISIDDIYGKAMLFTQKDLHAKTLKVVARRK